MELVDVTVTVPRDRVSEFYEWFARWSRRQDERIIPGGVAPLDWGSEEHDADLAATVWDRLTARAQRLLGLFLDDPEAVYSGKELADLAGIPHGKSGVAGTLAWPGRHSLAVRRKLPLEFGGENEGDGEYRMRPETAELFRQARDRAVRRTSG